jgi:hypothetical protein
MAARFSVMAWLFRTLDFIRLPWLIEACWRLTTWPNRLTDPEIAEASRVFGTDTVDYASVRVAHGGLLPLFFKLNKGRAFVLFRTVNLPRTGRSSRENLDILTHELVHVLQYQLVGSVYIWQALRAQRTEGYGYGGWEALAADPRPAYSGFNREQQGQIVQDYYRLVVSPGRAEDDPIRAAYEPLIGELRRGDL